MIKQNVPNRNEKRRTTTAPIVESTKRVVLAKLIPATKLIAVVMKAKRQRMNTYIRNRRKYFILYIPTQLLIQGQ